MNNNEEPVQAINVNDQVSTQGKPLPEQPAIPICNIPRQMSIYNLIYQWQPMGIRIVLNLPFIGNDQDFLFYIRNGPFIPVPPQARTYIDDYYDSNPDIYKGLVSSYGANNMGAVYLFGSKAGPYPDYDDKTKDFPIVMTQYDLPPAISTIAQSFRRWRGDMQYRIRVVAGFATQGYIIITPLKNVYVPIGIYNQFKVRPTLQRQDNSYRYSMMNAYALADTSMYRHVEITMPYDYPTPYYDQYAWMARRAVPAPYWALNSGPDKKPIIRQGGIKAEPHGDNFIGIGLRGNLAATQPGSQIEFELEYRCCEGFQFADPFLPPTNMCQSTASVQSLHLPYRIPSRDYTSDGVGPVTQVAEQVEIASSFGKKLMIRPKREIDSTSLLGRLGASSRLS
nr:MAG: putative capsid protein 3 [Polycipiviridae sp.]